MATPHIAAERGQIAPTVLMPGDPLRSRYIAENFLESPVLFNNVRGVQGYTGRYRSKPVSVMASGMGMPSIGIYSHELYAFFGVENIIRVGTMGSVSPRAALRDVVAAMGASTDSAYADQYGLPGTFAPIADFGLLRAAVAASERLGTRLAVGNVLSSDHFYTDDPDSNLAWRKMGVLGVEMETAALYMNAARAGKAALGLFSVSDELLTGARLTTEERQSSLDAMIRLALETAADMAE